MATSLAPLGTRFTEPLPTGVVDFGEVVWSQPDAFVAWDAVEAADPAWEGPAETLTQLDLVELARSTAGHQRVATTAQPVSDAGARLLVRALASGGGTVWVPPHQADRLPDLAVTEHAQPA